MAKKRLGELLVESGLITDEQLKLALKIQKRDNLKLGRVLVQLDLASELDILQTVAYQLGIPYVDLETETIDKEAVAMVGVDMVRKYMVMPVKFNPKEKILMVAMTDPMDYNALRDLRFATNAEIRPLAALENTIMSAITQHYHLPETMEGSLQHIDQETFIEIVPDSHSLDEKEVEDLKKRSEMAPVVRMANMVLQKAIENKASDIHIEPQQKNVQVRFRTDGLLKTMFQLPKWVQGPLISRVKIIGRMDIAEKRVPQDGRVKIRLRQREIDLRISTLPAQYGESVVIRILDQSQSQFSLGSIGLSPPDEETLHNMVARPQGMILITGPTGSGKSSTLYTIINQIKDEVKNIITVEDPIEYNIESINQVQTNEKAGLTFANGLRSILRQDPDVIMIGEIRDFETAEIACRAALTGHLVLSTLHTNDAPSAITRLLDIGVPGYIIASSVVGVIAQRLVRRICPRCGEQYTPPPETLKRLQLPKDSDFKFYHGKGCSFCSGSGYRGRIGLYEVLNVTPELQELIGQTTLSESAIRDKAQAQGMKTIVEDGLAKANEGITTPEELFRITMFQVGLQSLCPRCKTGVAADFVACPHCGYNLVHNCLNCGKIIDPDWKLCPYCRRNPKTSLTAFDIA